MAIKKMFQNSRGQFSKTATYFFVVFMFIMLWLLLYILFPQKVAEPDESLIIALLSLFASLYWGRRFTEAWEAVKSAKFPPPSNMDIVKK